MSKSKIRNLKTKFELAVKREAEGNMYCINMRKTLCGMRIYTALIMNSHVGNAYDEMLDTDIVELSRYQFEQKPSVWQIPELSTLETGNLYMTRDDWEMLIRMEKN